MLLPVHRGAKRDAVDFPAGEKPLIAMIAAGLPSDEDVDTAFSRAVRAVVESHRLGHIPEDVTESVVAALAAGYADAMLSRHLDQVFSRCFGKILPEALEVRRHRVRAKHGRRQAQ